MRDTLFAFGRGLLFAILCGSPAAVRATDCPAGQISEAARVDYVYDGDTVRLTDGRRLRLIGIDTPEIGHHGDANQPFATEARSFLDALLKANDRVLKLQPGSETRDHYGRLLAHAFLENGGNVAVRLLDAGLAITLVVPPNTWSMDCYQRHEDKARAAHRGVWSLPAYQPQESTSLPGNTTGFRIVRGRITGIRHTRYAVWLDLAGMLTVRISNKDLANFKRGYLDTLTGKRVEIRGWIKASRDKVKTNVRHPAALRILTAEASPPPA